jgi:hypothetical protein
MRQRAPTTGSLRAGNDSHLRQTFTREYAAD